VLFHHSLTPSPYWRLTLNNSHINRLKLKTLAYVETCGFLPTSVIAIFTAAKFHRVKVYIVHLLDNKCSISVEKFCDRIGLFIYFEIF